MQCTRCGATIPEGPEVRFCRTCGAELALAAVPVSAVLSRVAEGYVPAPTNGQVDGHVPAVAPVVPPPPAEGVVQVSVPSYGGFWIRLVARVIDEVILFGTALLAVAMAGFAVGILAALSEVEAEVPKALWSVVSLVVTISYRVLFPPLLGATPGKLLLGYHIVDDEGRHISFRRSVGRFLAQILSGMVLGLGFVWIAFDSCKQGWHDQIAGTFVVRKELVKP